MRANSPILLDLAPPAFADGLDDWSRTDGTPDSPTYETADNVRIPRGDPDFGTCLELMLRDPVQRLRYMGEVPMRPGRFIEIVTRAKAMQGPLPMVQIAASAGGAGGATIADLPAAGPLIGLPAHEVPLVLSAVIGPEARDGVDLIWDARALFARIGIDLIGRTRTVVRIEDIAVRDVTARFAAAGPRLPGFGARR